MGSFDINKLNGGSGGQQKRGARPERLFIEVDEYLTPEGGHAYAVGRRIDKPEETVKVRLNSVSERLADRPDLNAEKVKALYSTGENVRGSIASKQKDGVKLLSFDDARRIGVDENGVVEYRAHWSKTMSNDPKAEYMIGQAHIRLKDADPAQGRDKGQAYVEMMRWSLPIDKDNVDEALLKAFSIKDDAGRARDPLVALRVSYEGDTKASAKVFGKLEEDKKYDPITEEYKTVRRAVDADKTIEFIMSGQPGFTKYQTAELDKARAIICAIKGLPEPKFNSDPVEDKRLFDAAQNIYYGVESGALKVELIASEKIDFGSDSRKTYLSNKDLPQLAVYNGTNKEIVEDNKVRVTKFAGYTNTVVAFHRHSDGEPYAVFASPQKMSPFVKDMNDIPLQPAPMPEFAMEKTAQAGNSVTAVAPKPDPEVVEDDDNDYAP